MGMAILFMVLVYLGVVVVPASLAVLFALIKNARSRQFWLAGALSSFVLYWVLPVLRVQPPPNSATPGPGIVMFFYNVASPVSWVLAGLAVGALVFNILQQKSDFPWLRGLTLGVGFASVYWLVLLFSA